MHAFLVTGVSGAGKSTMARQLCDWGYAAVSADADAVLCAWTDAQGRRVIRPPHPSSAWLRSHQWRWDPDRLDEILSEARRGGVATVWLCGQAANAVELSGRFDAVFLLDVDPQTMAARMRRTERGNDFGRVGDSVQAAVAGYESFVAEWRRQGAIRIDATRDVVSVAEDLLMSAGMAVLRKQ